MELQAYVVCVEPRVVLFGYADKDEFDKKVPVLKNARMLVRWRGKSVLSTSSIGPQQGSRVSPPSPEIQIRTKIECVMPCTEKARIQWEKGIWDE